MRPWLDLRLCALPPQGGEAVTVPGAMTGRRFDPEPVLLGAVRAGIALVLLTPLVTAPWTPYPFSGGPELSWWPTHGRMRGFVNAAHWTAFALAAASVARTQAEWTPLLNVNLAVGLCVSVLAILRHLAPELPLPRSGGLLAADRHTSDPTTSCITERMTAGTSAYSMSWMSSPARAWPSVSGASSPRPTSST